jgi:hypothetical protein
MRAGYDQRETFATAADGDYSTWLRDFVEPALAHFTPRVRRAFEQT